MFNSFELFRLTVNSIPAVTINLFSALILFGEDIRSLWKKGLIYGFTIGTFTFLTYHLTDIELFRMTLNLVGSLLFIKILFKFKWLNTIKIFIASQLYIIVSELILMVILLYGLGIPLHELINLSLAIWVALVIYILVFFLTLFFRSKLYKTLYFFAKIKEYSSFQHFKHLSLAVFFQTILLVGFFTTFFRAANINGKFQSTLLLGAFLVLIGLNFFILKKNIDLGEERLVKVTGESISENIMNLVNSVRSQRHDFINCLQVISSLNYSNDKKGLEDYLTQLSADVSLYNDILRIDNSIIGAILNAKITQANTKGISLEVQSRVKLANISSKSLDITRILGNLIDNALEALENSKEKDKFIKVEISETGPFLNFSIMNPASDDKKISEKCFEPGFSTKGDQHVGLGLYACKQLAQKLHGKIEYKQKSGMITFTLIIPKP